MTEENGAKTVDTKDAEKEKVLKEFVKELTSILPEGNLISVMSFTPWYMGMPTDEIGTWIVVNKLDADVMEKLAVLSQKYVTPTFGLPIVSTMEEIEGINDSFPISLFDILTGYNIEYGQDLFEKVEIDTRGLRAQVEMQLRTMVMMMRQRYLETNFSEPGAYARLLSWVIKDVLVASRLVLLLPMGKYIERKEDIINEMGKYLGTELKENLKELTTLLDAKSNIDKEKANEYYFKATNFVSNLLVYVDKIGD
ncbi:MAG: hypothetical protein QW728_00775 [Thermoplasmata archaeon]